MYKATHSYEGQESHVLSFAAGESLCILEKSNEAWWFASNIEGKLGYVPQAYIQKEKDDSDVVLQSINNAIEEIIASSPAGSLPPSQQALLQKLLSHKDSLSSSQRAKKSSSKRRAPPPPPVEDLSGTQAVSSSTHKTPPPVPVRVQSQPTSSATYADNGSSVINADTSGSTSFEQEKGMNETQQETQSHEQSSLEHHDGPKASVVKHEVPEELGSELLNILKGALNPNETKCCAALSTLVLAMKNAIPTLEDVFDDIIKSIPSKDADDESDNLGLALENLREIKDDAQQRNWAIEDDEDKIMSILNEILTELTTIEKSSSISALSYDHKLPIHTLVDYHQMETRIALRLVILQIFGVVCSLSKSFVSMLLTTVLPLELARDMMTHTEDTQRTCYSALVMSMLFSTAEPIPVGHYGHLNKAFVQFLINYIEGDTENVEQDDQIVEMFVNVILSFNLHMQLPSENIIMHAVAERGTCTVLGEKVMMLVNRGDDPVAMEEHWTESDQGRPPSSVLKFLQDIYSERRTSLFLYTNDMNVLIDIITRNLTDLPSGSKLRTDYLDLLLNILTNTSYSENRHRSTDIGQSLNRILSEEQPDADAEKEILDFDKRIIDIIMSDFGHLFA